MSVWGDYVRVCVLGAGVCTCRCVRRGGTGVCIWL